MRVCGDAIEDQIRFYESTHRKRGKGAESDTLSLTRYVALQPNTDSQAAYGRRVVSASIRQNGSAKPPRVTVKNAHSTTAAAAE